jgi:hypothetical protein
MRCTYTVLSNPIIHHPVFVDLESILLSSQFSHCLFIMYGASFTTPPEGIWQCSQRVLSSRAFSVPYQFAITQVWVKISSWYTYYPKRRLKWPPNIKLLQIYICFWGRSEISLFDALLREMLEGHPLPDHWILLPVTLRFTAKKSKWMFFFCSILRYSSGEFISTELTWLLWIYHDLL